MSSDDFHNKGSLNAECQIWMKCATMGCVPRDFSPKTVSQSESISDHVWEVYRQGSGCFQIR